MSVIGTDEVGLILAFREFLGWCLVLNSAILLLSTVALAASRKGVSGIHARLFGVDEPFLSECYFRYLAYFKIAVIVFNLTPYVALHIMF